MNESEILELQRKAESWPWRLFAFGRATALACEWLLDIREQHAKVRDEHHLLKLEAEQLRTAAEKHANAKEGLVKGLALSYEWIRRSKGTDVNGQKLPDIFAKR